MCIRDSPKPLDDTFVGIEVKGVSYSEKAEGGQKIIDTCKEMTSPDPVSLGKYRGFDLELFFEPFEKVYQVKIKGSLSRSVSLGTDAIGNITRIDNAIEKIPERLEVKKQELETVEQQFATAKKEAEKPFDKEEELTKKTNRLNVLNGLLNVDTVSYTHLDVYKRQAMEQMGLREGNILEPSCGIGNFIGMLPTSMQNSKIYGVEIDKISAGIAQQLYQKTSIAAQPFEEANIPDSFFDAVIGNVPFGDFKVNDRRYNKHSFLIHDYFFAKCIDKLKPGGVMALITSNGISGGTFDRCV